MPVPVVYDEGSLANYVVRVLGAGATVLGWDITHLGVHEVVTDTMLLLGVTDLADATDMTLVRAAARVALWRAVAQATAGWYDVVLDDQSLKRSQLHAQALAALALAEQDLSAAGGGGAYSIRVGVVNYSRDPYGAVEEIAL